MSVIQKNKPLITNTLTVTGDCLPIERQHNYLFRIGTPLSFIAEYAGGVPESAAKIISGGPMMGKAISRNGQSISNERLVLLYGLIYGKRRSHVLHHCAHADRKPAGLDLTVHHGVDELFLTTLRVALTSRSLRAATTSAPTA